MSISIEELNRMNPDSYQIIDIRDETEIGHGAIPGAVAVATEEIEGNEKIDFSMYSNITDITERSMDIQELLMDTDILVTDYSSTYIDYLLLDRPVVFYNFDYQDYLEHDRGMYCDYEKAAPGYKAETFEALMEEFERLVQGEDHFKEVRRQARDFFYCKEGQGMVGETLLGILKNIK